MYKHFFLPFFALVTVQDFPHRYQYRYFGCKNGWSRFLHFLTGLLAILFSGWLNSLCFAEHQMVLIFLSKSLSCQAYHSSLSKVSWICLYTIVFVSKHFFFCRGNYILSPSLLLAHSNMSSLLFFSLFACCSSDVYAQLNLGNVLCFLVSGDCKIQLCSMTVHFSTKCCILLFWYLISQKKQTLRKLYFIIVLV